MSLARFNRSCSISLSSFFFVSLASFCADEHAPEKNMCKDEFEEAIGWKIEPNDSARVRSSFRFLSASVTKLETAPAQSYVSNKEADSKNSLP